jgi:hypothetical protein
VHQDLQLVSQSENQEVLGPFGRSFVGDFPTKGTLWMFILAILVSAWIAGGLLSFLLFSIISVYLAIYFCYNYIEPHFNSRIGVERKKRLSRITKDPNHLAMGDIGRLFHGYGKSKAKQLWDLSGEGSLKGIFETDHENTSMNSEFIGASEKKWVSWLIIISFLTIGFIASRLVVIFVLAFLYSLQ